MVAPASRMPVASSRSSPPCSLLRRANCRVRAVEEANPASMLVSTSPARVPSRRTAKWPQNEMPAITTTINQILKGLKASRGAHLLVGQYRQQYQRDEQKAQGGVEFGFAEKQHPLLDLSLQAHQQGGQHGAGDRLARAQQYRHQPQQIGEQHGYRAGETKLPLPALGQPDREAAADHHRQQAEQRQPGAQGGQQQTAYPAEQADKAVGTHPGDALVVPQLTHLPAPFQSDDEADGQRDQGTVDRFCIDPHNDFLFVICLPCSHDGTASKGPEGHGSQSLRLAPGAGG